MTIDHQVFRFTKRIEVADQTLIVGAERVSLYDGDDVPVYAISRDEGERLMRLMSGGQMGDARRLRNYEIEGRIRASFNEKAQYVIRDLCPSNGVYCSVADILPKRPLSLIVATLPQPVDMGGARVIGRDGGMPWKCPEDMAFFRRTTTGHPIVMGSKTYDSIGRPLPKRTNIVLSRTRAQASFPDEVIVVRSAKEAIEKLAEIGDPEPFVIGGAEIYLAFISYVSKIYMTVIPQAMATAPTIEFRRVGDNVRSTTVMYDTDDPLFAWWIPPGNGHGYSQVGVENLTDTVRVEISERPLGV